MREKELRLALVCFGGVSLAIYMHGVTKEILKLARGSQAYHNTPDPLNRKSLTYLMVRKNAQQVDTESVYFDFLKEIGADIDLRVVVDAVAGASAGGMNAVFLARALAHDLSLDGLRDVWLHEADITQLSVPRKPVGLWGRLVTTPLVKLALKKSFGKDRLSENISEKIPGIFRFRRMKPPFDGPKLLKVLYDALEGMGRHPSPLQSLLPAGHRLDLFVTVTDFFGHLVKIPLHDPPEIEEREHRHILHFSYLRWRNGEYKSEMDLDDVGALAFAARATSSFPGAFPPAQIKEVDRLMASRNIKWHKREHFLFNNFANYYKAGLDPTKTSFLDGSVLNNKPFAQAIQAIADRPAYRQVDRRIVYIDPHPQDQPPPPSGVVPSFLRTLRAALSDIPRNEPIHDDLAGIQAYNKRVGMVRTIISSIKPSVERQVSQITNDSENRPKTVEEISRWREKANALAAHQNGISYESYARLKVSAVIDDSSQLIAEVCGFAEDSRERQSIHDILYVWAHQDEIDDTTILTPASGPTTPKEKVPTWIRFLQRFDVAYQKRRVRFVIHQLNDLYSRYRDENWEDVDVSRLDGLKAIFYESLAHIRKLEKIDFISDETRHLLNAAFVGAFDAGPDVNIDEYLQSRSDELEVALDAMAADIQLTKTKLEVDRIFADLYENQWPPAIISELIVSYLGFAFWDVITYVTLGTRELGEFNEIRVDRISANDAKALNMGKAEQRLKGVALAHFGAFFSRKDRENDYLWGRLDGAERLIDILYDAAKADLKNRDIDLMPFKKRAFLAILEEEARHLIVSSALIAELRAAAEKL